MNKASILAVSAALAAAISGCGSGGGSPDPSVASLSIGVQPAPQGAASACAMRDGTCDCPRGATAHLTIAARDASGGPVAIDPGAIAWSSSDGASISVSASGDGADVSALRDLFDAQGSEPTAAVTAAYGGVSASIPVTAVIDAHGRWRADLDVGFSYVLDLSQSGRDVVDSATGYGGEVTGDMLDLSVSGIDVHARFSTRTDVSGTYSGPGNLNGTLTCTKQ